QVANLAICKIREPAPLQSRNFAFNTAARRIDRDQGIAWPSKGIGVQHAQIGCARYSVQAAELLFYCFCQLDDQSVQQGRLGKPAEPRNYALHRCGQVSLAAVSAMHFLAASESLAREDSLGRPMECDIA